MAAIAAALSIGPENDACRNLCAEVLGAARHWGPAEQRVLFERLPALMQRLYSWLSLPNAGLEEALLRTFHPSGPLSAHLAALESPAFVFPLQRLPPRACRAAVLSVADPDQGAGSLSAGLQALRRTFRDQGSDLGSPWFSMLGSTRLARSPGGDVEGVTLTAQEFVLTCLVNYLVSEPLPAPTASKSGGSSSSSSSGANLSGTSSGASGFMGGGSARTSKATLGALSQTYERLLLSYLGALLPHSQYELSYSAEPRASRFFLRLLQEFLLSPQPPSEHLPESLLRRSGTTALDVRAQPEALHSARLVALHILANPSLRQGCEESVGSNGLVNGGKSSRITREVSLLGPSFVQMLAEVLINCSQQQAGLETLNSLTKLWLVLLQPYKARRLYEWYVKVRPPSPRLEPPEKSSSLASRPSRPVDVALVGIEPDLPPGSTEVLTPLVPQEAAKAVEVQAGASSTGATFAAAVGFSSGISVAANAAASSSLVPGDGDPLSWRSFVSKFHGAYCLLEAFLTTPLHAELCLELCRLGAGWAPLGRFGASSSDSFAASQQPAIWGNAQQPTAQQLLRQRNAVQSLKTLGQVLLCFSNSELLQVLSELQANGSSSSWMGPPAVPLFDDTGALRPQIVLAVSVTWAALLASASVVELQPLIAVVSRQLQHAPQWSSCKLPAMEDTDRLKSFAQEVLQEVGQRPPASLSSSAAAQQAPERPLSAPSSLTSGPSAPASAEVSTCGISQLSSACFVGSEWQRPMRGGELELLLQMAYWLADLIDRLLDRQPRLTSCGQVPQTEWPRLLANWKFAMFVLLLVLFLVVW
eukprot:TRINITY_DN29545_c0_g1_i1.p1 TRINITY_DN29545_c0_g1~~TRINITY_DN29545_c0_g1_i1.p1  ORF type:complete len:829 (-),score=171.41 TRINITY_DN29545_c0_g1_i1:59-2506(-)